jgi:response regulator NasT
VSQALRILVADDERDTREYFHDMMSRLGHTVVTADNGKHLLELARATEPDLIVTDVRMPEMDGIEAALLVNQDRAVPVILVSGFHDAALLERARAEHFMAYLIKPIKQADVEAAIAVALARFHEYRGARQQITDLQKSLEERKLIERAKGVVMRRLRVDEQEAFRRLKKLSSHQNRKLAEVAEKVLEVDEVFQLMD